MTFIITVLELRAQNLGQHLILEHGKKHRAGIEMKVKEVSSNQ